MANSVTRINIAFPRRTLRNLRRCVRRGEYSRFVARAVELELARIRSGEFLRGAGALRVTAAHPFWDSIAASDRIERAEHRAAVWTSDRHFSRFPHLRVNAFT